MSQEEVYKFLKKNKNKWFTTKELRKKLKIGCVSANLKKLKKYGEIRMRIKKTPYITFVWKFKK